MITPIISWADHAQSNIIHGLMTATQLRSSSSEISTGMLSRCRSQDEDWAEPRFVCERVCTGDKLLRRVGSAAKVRAVDSCTLQLGVAVWLSPMQLMQQHWGRLDAMPFLPCVRLPEYGI